MSAINPNPVTILKDATRQSMFDFASEIVPDFYCPVYDILERPAFCVPCGHVYDHKTIENWMSKIENFTCPACDASIVKLITEDVSKIQELVQRALSFEKNKESLESLKKALSLFKNFHLEREKIIECFKRFVAMNPNNLAVRRLLIGCLPSGKEAIDFALKTASKARELGVTETADECEQFAEQLQYSYL